MKKEIQSKTKKRKEKKKKPKSPIKIIFTIIVYLILLICCYFIFINIKNKKSVFDETTLKNLKLKNRVFFGPISHSLEKIENVAKNDVALVITEGAVVCDYSESRFHTEGPFRIEGDEYIPEIKELANVAHKYNSYLILFNIRFSSSGLNIRGTTSL